MEKTENNITVRAEDVPSGEIHQVYMALAELIEHGEVTEDSPLVAALYFILDTLEAGKDITIMTAPDPNDYVLLGEALARAEDFGNRYGAGPR